MRSTLKASLTALMLTSVAAVPLATAPTFLGADAAYAKSDKAKGGGNKGGKSGERAKGKSGSKGKSGDRTSSRGHGGLDGFFDKLTGKGKGKGKGKGSAKKATAVAAAEVEPTDCGGEGQDECAPELRQLHPSELGKMNGALNANENAILAHIRNGNMSNGPVGLMAAYAYHSVGTAEARELVNSQTAEEYQAYQDALAEAGVETEMDFETWVAEQQKLDPNHADYDPEAVGDFNPDYAMIAMDFDMAKNELGSSEFEDLGGYGAYDAIYNEDGTLKEGAEENEELKAAYDALGTYDADTAQAIEDAGEDIGAYDDALAGLYEAWNKGDADSENADDLKAMLDARVAEYTEVQALYEEMNPPEEDPMDGDEMTDCEEGVEGCEAGEEELAAAE